MVATQSIYDKVLAEMAIKALECEDVGPEQVLERYVVCLEHSVISPKLFVVWGCDCAERVLPIYERQYPGDFRLREAINTVRRWIEGDVSRVEVTTAITEVRAMATPFYNKRGLEPIVSDSVLASGYVTSAVLKSINAAGTSDPSWVLARSAAREAAAARYYSSDVGAQGAARIIEVRWQLQRLRTIIETSDRGAI